MFYWSSRFALPFVGIYFISHLRFDSRLDFCETIRLLESRLKERLAAREIATRLDGELVPPFDRALL